MRRKVFVTLMVSGMVSLFLMRPVHAVSAEDATASEAESSASSIFLVASAWEALNNDDLQQVLNLTNECVTRYGKRARLMQEKLDDYATGTESEIRLLWALNDVATALFIKGKALQNAGEYDRAKASYEQLLKNYRFGQCWDPKGWFWKPAEVAVENLVMIRTGIYYDFGDYTSATLMAKAWEALEQEDIKKVLGYTDECIKLYADRAREMQAELSDYPKGEDEEIFAYWALNDVATAHFIRARAYLTAGKDEDARREFQTILDEFSYGQCWDPKGWFWKPAIEASHWLKASMGEG